MRPGCFSMLVLLAILTPAVWPRLFAEEPPAVEAPAVETPTVAASGLTAPTATQGIEELVRRVQPSVAVLSYIDRDGSPIGVGSGVVIREDGLIATNLHVLGEARPVHVRLFDGREFDVKQVFAHEKEQDLAIVKIDVQGLPALDLGDSEKLQTGQSVVAFGNPEGLTHSVVAGVVSAVREDVNGMPMIQLAIPIERGNSGGPLVDLEGKIAGLLTLKSLVTDNLGYAVTVNALKPLLEKPNPIPMSKWLTIGVLNPRHWTTRGEARWTQHAGHVRVEGAKGSFMGQSLCLSTTEPPAVPFEAAVSVRVNELDGAAGLAFHSDGEDRHYGFYPSDGRLRVSRFDGPVFYEWSVLWEEDRPEYRPGEWNNLKIRVEADRVLCLCNGVVVHELKDDRYHAGKVGLVNFRHTTAEFKGFRIAERIESPSLDEATRKQLEEIVAQADAAEPPRPEVVDKLRPLGAVARTETFREAEKLEQKAKWLRQLAAAAYQAEVRSRLVAALSPPDGEPDLLTAALLVAALDDEELDVDFYRGEVEALATELKGRFKDDMSENDRLQELHRLMFEENGFHGSRTNYYSESNSHLNEVIDDREGQPITLSVLYMEIARRAGLSVEGVGMPGHFLVRFLPQQGEKQLIDVYDGGEFLTREQALVQSSPGTLALGEAAFERATPRQIIIRILRNLMFAKNPQDDPDRALRYLDAAIAIDPDSVESRGLRAVLRYQTNRIDEGLEDVGWLLERQPDGLDLSQVARLRDALEEKRATRDKAKNVPSK